MRTKTGEFAFRYNAVDVYFGLGVVPRKLSSVISGHVKALVVASRRAPRISGALEDVLKALRSRGLDYVLFDQVTPNPDTAIVDKAVEIAEEEGVDLVVGVGGGSVIDVAKAVSILAGSGVSAVHLVKGQTPPREGRLSLVVINLTHGTGSEVNRFAVLTIKGTIEKRGFKARYPNASFDDPVYTRTLDAKQTIYTSLDAFYHAYESATSKNSNLMVASLAREAVDHIASSLPVVINEPARLEHRSKLLFASMIAGMAIDIAGGSHLAHALEHGFSGLNPELPHGAGLAMLGARVVYYTHKAVPDVSAYVLKPLNPTIKPISEHAENAMKTVVEFQKSLGFDERLSDYGIGKDDLSAVLDFVERTIAEKYHANIPFPVDRGILETIVLEAL